MNVEAVAGELRAALATIPGLKLPAWGVQRISPPAAIVALPTRIEYDYSGYGRGADRYPDAAVIVLVGRPTTPAAQLQIAAYADGSGPQSIKAAIENHTYTQLDAVRVAWAEFDDAKYAGTDYLAAIFHLDIVGSGSVTA